MAEKLKEHQYRVDNDVFFEELLCQISNGKSVKILARGYSMYPLIRHNIDNVQIAPLDERSITKGSIVLAKVDGRYILHRIERINREIVTLRGDGNPYQRELCTPANILAELRTVYRGKLEIQKGSFLWELERFCWPRNGFVRRVLLAVNRRLRGFLHKSKK
ncbi:MAG: hypothetical protein SPI35_03255 [Porphyromonas sp.]|nr:hypothetical protein [Porphyromonas sp.]